MGIEFTQEQLKWQEKARDFAEKEIVPLSRKLDETDEFPHELFYKMRKEGFQGLTLPKEYGGSGVDMATAAFSLVELSKANASVGFTLDAHWLSAETIYYFGTEGQRKKYIPQAVTDTFCSFALTEPSGGSDAAAIKTTAIRDGDDYILNGSKSWCTNSEVAGLFIVMAKTNSSKGDKGITAFLVEKDTPGFTVGKRERKMGLRGGSMSNQLFFDNCRISKENVLGKEGQGFLIAMKGLDIARICISAVAIGTAEAAYKISKDYVKTRNAFGAPISSYQGILFKITDMARGIYTAKLLLNDVANMATKGLLHRKESAILKLYTSDLAFKSAEEAVQIYGGNGYSPDYPAEQLMRDAKVLQIAEGPNEIMRMLIGRMALAEE